MLSISLTFNPHCSILPTNDLKEIHGIPLKPNDPLANYMGAATLNARIRAIHHATEQLKQIKRPNLETFSELLYNELIKKGLKKICVKGEEIKLNVITVENPDLDAAIVAQSIAEALENRQSFRTAQKKAIMRTMKAGAKGIKIMVSGRVGGAEIARSEMYSEGNVSLHTLRADIDYALAEADTTFGKLGVKVWINHGEILDGGLKPAIPEEPKREGRKGRRDGERRPRRDGERRKNDRRREERPEAPKAVNPRVRKTPKVEPQVEEAQVEAVEAVAEESAE